MSLSVVVPDSKKNGHNSAIVIVEGDTPDEAMNSDSKRLALEYAATLGVTRPGVGLGGSAYPHHPEAPTSSESTTGDQAKAANLLGCKYRVDWPITGGL